MKKTTILTIALFICGILTGLIGAFSIGKDAEIYHLKTEVIEQSEMIDSLKAANDSIKNVEWEIIDLPQEVKDSLDNLELVELI
jgi:hypothetical protein